MIFEIEYWFFTGDEEKDFEVDEIQADSYAEAVDILRLKNICVLGQPTLLSTKKPTK